MERRRFIAKAGTVLATVGATAVVDAPNVIAQPKFKWRMPTLWTPALDVLQGSALRLAKTVDEMTGGRFQIALATKRSAAIVPTPAISHARRSRDFRRAATGAGIPARDPASETHRSSSSTSRAVW